MSGTPRTRTSCSRWRPAACSAATGPARFATASELARLAPDDPTVRQLLQAIGSPRLEPPAQAREQVQLPVQPRRPEQVGALRQLAAVEAVAAAGLAEALADQLGEQAGAAHPAAEVGVVEAAVAALADQRQDVGGAARDSAPRARPPSGPSPRAAGGPARSRR